MYSNWRGHRAPWFHVAARVLCAIGVFAGATEAQSPSGHEDAPAALRVLFVGNSYTYENDLPFVFESLARSEHAVEVQMIASGGASLRRHLEQDDLLYVIENLAPDVVVLQEQSALGATRVVEGVVLIADPEPFLESVEEIARVTKEVGSRLVLFATWPRAEAPRNLNALHNAYREAADRSGASLAPVGLVWDELGGDACDALQLYGPDGSHPSKEGTYVAAAVLARTIFGEMPELAAIEDVPEMDGWAKPSGTFYDIDPSEAGRTALSSAIAAVFQRTASGSFPRLPGMPFIELPSLPSLTMRGRWSPRFLDRRWRGSFPSPHYSRRSAAGPPSPAWLRPCDGFDPRRVVQTRLRSKPPQLLASQNLEAPRDDLRA